MRVRIPSGGLQWTNGKSPGRLFQGKSMCHSILDYQGWECRDCRVDTKKLQMYMVHTTIWNKYGAGRGMLCMRCLEGRMKRSLVTEDFTECSVNTRNTEVQRIRSLTVKEGILHAHALARV